MKINEAEQKALGDLWKKYKATGKTDYRDALIVQYLFLVKYVVSRIASGLPAHVKLDDLYSSGVTGLIKSVERFDVLKNKKFEAYAVMLIKGAIIDELRSLDWIPRSVHQKAQMIASAQEKLQQKLGREPTETELSNHLGLTSKELEELLCRVRPAILIPLNAQVYESEESSSIADRIPDHKARTSFEIAYRKEFNALLEKAISSLPEQEKKVLVLYYYEELMLREIGEILGVSESRVSQIHTKAILKLRQKLQTFAQEYAQAL